MLIRKAGELDRGDIVSLLRSSLGDSSSSKSIEYWIWKHEQNPFGKSEVMLSFNNLFLSGVRAMMPWGWQIGYRQFKTYRAVDTATHPDYQGKGIFRKLTMEMLNVLEVDQPDFIFNTPNKKSLPGYLKMGWQSWGRIEVRLIPFFLIHFCSLGASAQEVEISQTENLCQQWNDKQSQSGMLFTPKSPAYLNWRYIDNPVINYQCLIQNDLFVAAHIKKHKWFNELRISELITVQKPSDIKSRLAQFLKSFCTDNKIHVITLSKESGQFFKLPGFIFSLGPLLTIRKLSVQEEIPALLQWSPALGDLELF